MGNNISTQDFVLLVASIRDYDFDSFEQLCDYGRKKGWLEAQEADFKDWEIDRKSAARILHEFLRIECDDKDIADWSQAKALKDLYDCRVCASHIANVYIKGIMEPVSDKQFGLLKKITQDEAGKIIEKARSYYSSIDLAKGID